MQKFSYHTHTDFSDGHHSAEQMVQQAARLGWEEIGISDHLIVHKNIRQSVSWPWWSQPERIGIFHAEFKSVADHFSRHAERLRQLGRRLNVKVRVGAEVDFFNYDGWLEEFSDFYTQVGLDYCISGNHFLPLSRCEQIVDAKDSMLLDDQSLNNALRLHFALLAQAALSKKFVFIAHLDYLRKIPAWQSGNFIVEQNMVTEALKKSGTAVELSSKGLRKQGAFYPEENWLKQVIAADIPLVISDDAHCCEELAYEFGRAEHYLQQLDCCRRWRFVAE